MSVWNTMDTSGSDWWLSSQTDSGRERYPDRIRVGSPGRPRVYVPERTCRAVLQPYEPGVEEFPVCSECGRQLLLEDDDEYCPGCGARVVDE